MRIDAVLISLFCFGIVANPFAMAQGTNANQELPSIDKVLQQYIAAIGGVAKWQNLQTMNQHGKVELPEYGAVGTVEIQKKAGMKSRMKVQFENVIYYDLLNGNAGRKGPLDSPKIKDEAEIKRDQRTKRLLRPLHIKELYVDIQVTRSEIVGGRRAIIARGTTKSGEIDEFVFDAVNKLLIEERIQKNDSPRGYYLINRFEDYRNIGGIKTPFKVLSLIGRGTKPIVLRVEKTEFGKEFSDELFALK